MDNVMIDERRIRVDFSQSVSKLMPKNRNAQLQKQTVKTDIPPKTRTLQTKIKLEGKQYYGASHYDIVTPETSRLMYKHGDQKEAEEQVP